jgi:hypothetical protein
VNSTNERWWATKTGQHGASTYLPAPQPVWVDLPTLFRATTTQTRRPTGSVDLTGRARGLLTARHRSSLGDWLAVVTYQLSGTDDRAEPELLQDQLVPFYALHPRADAIGLEGKPRDPENVAASSRLNQRGRGRPARGRGR